MKIAGTKIKNPGDLNIFLAIMACKPAKDHFHITGTLRLL